MLRTAFLYLFAYHTTVKAVTAADKLWFGVPTQNIDVLEDHALSLSDPRHTCFGHATPLSADEVLDVASTPTHVDAVLEHARHVSATNCVSKRDWVVCDYTADKCPRAPLPNVSDIVLWRRGDGASPSNSVRASATATTLVDTDPDYYIVPQTLSEQYAFPTDGGGGPVNVGAVEFLRDQSISFHDVEQYLHRTNRPSPRGWPPKIEGYWDNSSADVEASLDFDILIGNVPAAAANLWYWGSREWMVFWATDAVHTPALPDVLSISWGWTENRQCDVDATICTSGTTSQQYVRRANLEFLKLAARGVTLVASAGDAGSPGRTDEGCNNVPVLNPSFPASSPWVVAVGSTQFASAPPVLPNLTAPVCGGNACAAGGVAHERNCDLNTSCGYTGGSGFSTILAQPAWQRSAVASYLADDTAYKPDVFNRSGRGYPDLTALGSIHYFTVANGQEMSVGGTSASAPFIAACFSWVVSALGRSIGPGGPFLYRMAEDCPACFRTPVGTGWSNCTEDDCCATGYSSGRQSSWNPVHGLGLPNVTAWKNYALSSFSP